MRKFWNMLGRSKKMAEAEHQHEMFPHLPFPFRDNRFPHTLGAVIQRTVLDGKQPARVVIHTLENDWLVGDGINDPISQAQRSRHVCFTSSSRTPQ